MKVTKLILCFLLILLFPSCSANKRPIDYTSLVEVDDTIEEVYKAIGREDAINGRNGDILYYWSSDNPIENVTMVLWVKNNRVIIKWVETFEAYEPSIWVSKSHQFTSIDDLERIEFAEEMVPADILGIFGFDNESEPIGNFMVKLRYQSSKGDVITFTHDSGRLISVTSNEATERETIIWERKGEHKG